MIVQDSECSILGCHARLAENDKRVGIDRSTDCVDGLTGLSENIKMGGAVTKDKLWYTYKEGASHADPAG